MKQQTDPDDPEAWGRLFDKLEGLDALREVEFDEEER
jgi:hypothetical protein